jgi:hypothetical protein
LLTKFIYKKKRKDIQNVYDTSKLMIFKAHIILYNKIKPVRRCGGGRRRGGRRRGSRRGFHPPSF